MQPLPNRIWDLQAIDNLRYDTFNELPRRMNTNSFRERFLENHPYTFVIPEGDVTGATPKENEAGSRTRYTVVVRAEDRPHHIWVAPSWTVATLKNALIDKGELRQPSPRCCWQLKHAESKEQLSDTKHLTDYGIVEKSTVVLQILSA